MRQDKTPTPDKHPANKPEGEDNLLDSIGKAITDPLTSGAEPEEPQTDGRSPVAPGG